MPELWRTTDAVLTSVICDGCEALYELASIHFVRDYGHECRYCTACAKEYEQWVAVSKAEEERRQKEFDAWQIDKRQWIPLKRMPMDFGPVKGLRTLPMVLG